MIPSEFWGRFKNEKIAVNCQTEDEARDFVKQCYKNGIEWFYSACDSKYDVNTTNYKNYENGICYRIFFDPANKISFVDVNMNYCRNHNYTIIPFSEINKPIKEESKMFKCSICGKEYDTPVDRARCEIECDKTNHIKAEKEKQDKLKAEKAKCIEEIDKAYVEYFETCTEAKEKYLKIVEQYNKDYGYEIKEKYPYLDDIFDSIQKVFKLVSDFSYDYNENIHIRW